MCVVNEASAVLPPGRPEKEKYFVPLPEFEPPNIRIL